jgi:hypothetical protein
MNYQKFIRRISPIKLMKLPRNNNIMKTLRTAPFWKNKISNPNHQKLKMIISSLQIKKIIKLELWVIKKKIR